MTSDAQLQRLVDFGIVEVKVGIESGDDESIKAMNKRHSAADVELACNRIADAGIDLTVYILLGGPIPHARRAAARTLNLCERIPAIDFVINVWAYNRPDPKPSDTHFSWDLVVEYGIEDLMPAFWQLQPQSKKSLGRIIDIHASRRPAVGASGSLSDESGQGSP
jgi:radical SAM superfamily enzyme YgiQ (UPF0313 family)